MGGMGWRGVAWCGMGRHGLHEAAENRRRWSMESTVYNMFMQTMPTPIQKHAYAHAKRLQVEVAETGQAVAGAAQSLAQLCSMLPAGPAALATVQHATELQKRGDQVCHQAVLYPSSFSALFCTALPQNIKIFKPRSLSGTKRGNWMICSKKLNFPSSPPLVRSLLAEIAGCAVCFQTP